MFRSTTTGHRAALI